ncbi:hypothetical protein [Wolbachia endosymbiont (group A) of Ennomos erosarius]|uniref:hypothetical protein n=1 Tax=Wolbachia endosymbiont (group A) of Ennomos erosarius TaxID=3066174 RepID=UPI003340074C
MSTLPRQNFLAYSTKDNDFKIRFENEEKPIEISNILRASSEGKVYNISLGKDSQITATKKGSERHYDFTSSGSCEMTINWQAKDSEGNSVDCSMTVEVSSKGIKRVIGEPKFGGITSSEEVLKLVGQNKEVFINGKTLHQAFTDIGQDMDSLEPTQDLSSQLPTPSSSGYSSPSTPSSRRSSFSSVSEFSGEDEMFESGTFDDEEEYKQEGEELENRVKELEEENTQLKKDKAELQRLNQEITEEGEEYRLALDISEKKVKELEHELKKREKELTEKREENEQLKQVVSASAQDKSDVIKSLNHQLKDKESEIQSTNRANEELQKKLDQGEIELSKLRAENTELRNDVKKIVEGLKDDHKKQLVEQLLEREEKLTDAISQLNEEQLNNQELARELNQLQKKIETLELASQQPNIGEKSLADEMSKGDARKGEEIKQKDLEIEKLKEDLKQLQEENKQLKQEVTKNAGVDASSSTGQKEAKEAEVIPQNIMDWPVPIPDDKPEEQKTPLEPIKVNTELSDPKSIPAEVSEKSPPLSK